MPRGKHGGGAAKRKERAVRAAYRKERKAGAYLSSGDPEFKSFSNQLAIQGLKLRDVPGDGNCLFRALAAQLGDRQASHTQLRRDVVEYMQKHRAEFEPFIDDHTSFDEYMSELAQDGEYAGNDAIVAFARCHSVNVVIHQPNAPHWEVHPPSPGGHTLHIAYLHGEHYCSVETLIPEDPLPGVRVRPPPVSPRGVSLSSLPPGEKKRGVSPDGEGKRGVSPGAERGGTAPDNVQTVVEATGCTDLEMVEQSLLENSDDPELAIVEVLQLMSLLEPSPAAGVGASQVSHKAEARQPQALQGKGRKRQLEPKKSTLPQSGHHLSNRERKAEAKAARKQRKREAGSGKPPTQSKEESFGSVAI